MNMYFHLIQTVVYSILQMLDYCQYAPFAVTAPAITEITPSAQINKTNKKKLQYNNTKYSLHIHTRYGKIVELSALRWPPPDPTLYILQ